MVLSLRNFLAAVSLCALTAAPVTLRAGPLAPCVAATLSANGKILVINELTFEDPDETHGRRPQTSTFRILHRFADANEGTRVNGPNGYWTDPMWSIVFKSGEATPFIACPYTLVTDDGEYLVLLGPSIGPAALSIYRRLDHPGRPLGGPGPDHGVLVRQISLSDIWPQHQAPRMFFDSTPQWYANGTFAFSPNQRTLILTTRSGRKVKIDLKTGEIHAE